MMKTGIQKISTGLAALVIATVVWLPCLHFVFLRPLKDFRQEAGISPKARALVAAQLQFWTDRTLQKTEVEKMRNSNREWDFMGRTFLVWSLANMSLREPESKAAYLRTMDQIIEETLQTEKDKGICFFLMSYGKPDQYVARPARSLFVDGEIALMLAARRMVEEKADYKRLLTERVDIMANGLRQSPHLILESYPDECWTFDHCVALDAMKMADRLDGSDHSALIHDWVAMAKEKLTDPKSGLLVASFTTAGVPISGPQGSTLWMAAHSLQLLDEDFARDQYERARKELGAITVGFGYAHEWPAAWPEPANVDSGPIVPGFDISAGSSGMAFIGAAAFGDKTFLQSLASTLDFAGFPSQSHGRLKYCASNQVGDAALLYAATLGPLWEKAKKNGRKP